MEKITVADVILWGKRIGEVAWDEENEVGALEYD